MSHEFNYAGRLGADALTFLGMLWALVAHEHGKNWIIFKVCTVVSESGKDCFVTIGSKLTPIVLTAGEQQQLSIALGGSENFWMLKESEFVAQSGCPPGELESWLENYWRQHDIKAVLAGSEVVGPKPHLLVRWADEQATMRLFCPIEKLLRENAKAEALASLREELVKRPWVESCEEIISQIAAVSAACAAGALSSSELKVLWMALWIAIQELLQLRNRPYSEHMQRLHASAVAFAKAFQERGNPSPQSKYNEARISSRRALGENHNPVLDGFPELVKTIRKGCSKELAGYLEEEVGLDVGQFLEMLQLLAHDDADPAAVANPPARIRYALTRQQARQARLHRARLAAGDFRTVGPSGGIGRCRVQGDYRH